MITCEWCGEPISAEGDEGFGYTLQWGPFHSLRLGMPSGRRLLVTEVHVHAAPCRAELSRAILDVLRDRQAEAEEDRAEGGAREDARRAWEKMSMADRERVALDTLGDDRLTIGELTDRLRGSLEPGCQVHGDHVTRLVRRLFKARELEREPQPRSPGSKAIRYRYSARRELEGPIVDLERAFNEPTGGEA